MIFIHYINCLLYTSSNARYEITIVRTTNKDMRMILELLWRIQEEEMKFAPMNYHYLRYSLKKFLDKVEQSVFNSIDPVSYTHLH